VLLYNTNVFKPPTSWSVVFEPQNLPDGKPNKGRVQAYDGPIYIADAALYLKSAKPELGIQNPYELTEAQYKAVLDLLRQQQPLIHRYWHDATVQMSDVKNEGVAPPVRGATWSTACRPRSSRWPRPFRRKAPPAGPTPPCCTARPSTPIAPTSGWTGRCSPRCRATWRPGSARCRRCRRPAGSELLGAEGCKTNGFDNFDKIAFWKTPQAEGGKFVPYSRWTQDYIAIMGGR
jgi:putative spermidine/putrescine transport system substrate-binding protein